jgi:hypothetical protein
MIKSKKAGEKIFSMWWFAVLAIVGVGIVTGVLMFYSTEIDARSIEAEILYNQISGCLIKQGFLINEVFNEEFNIFAQCGINPESFSQNSNFYFNVSIFNETKKLREDIKEGDHSYEKNCKIQEQVEARNFPKCKFQIMEIFYYKDNEIKSTNISILTASNQKIKRMEIVE